MVLRALELELIYSPEFLKYIIRPFNTIFYINRKYYKDNKRVKNFEKYIIIVTNT